MGFSDFFKPPPLTREAFLGYAYQYVESRLPGSATITPCIASFAFDVHDGEERYTVSLRKWHGAHCDAHRFRRRRLSERYAALRTSDAPLPCLAEAAPFLLPAMDRSRRWQWPNNGFAHMCYGSRPTAFQPVGARLGAVVVYDSPDRLESVRGGENDWGLSFDELFAHSLENLRARSHDAWMEVEPGVFAPQLRDRYVSSRLLLQDRVRALPVKGLPVAVSPVQHAAFITGDQDVSGLETLARLSGQVTAGAGLSLDSVPVRLADTGWQTWRPELAFPELRTWHQAYLRSTAQHWELLRWAISHAAKTGQQHTDDPKQAFAYLAYPGGRMIGLNERPEGEVEGIVEWRHSTTPTLLPRLDRVRLSQRADGRWRSCRLSLATVLRHFGRHVEPFHDFDHILIARTFPTEEELEAAGIDWS